MVKGSILLFMCRDYVRSVNKAMGRRLRGCTHFLCKSEKQGCVVEDVVVRVCSCLQSRIRALWMLNDFRKNGGERLKAY